MSTVVGTCGDCIVSLPPQPSTSMRFAVSVTEGFNLVLKQVGTVVGTYPATNMAITNPSLAPGASYTVGPVSNICIGTNSPLQVTVVSGGGVSFTLNVNSLIVLDDSYTTVTIHNPSTEVNALVSLFYASDS